MGPGLIQAGGQGVLNKSMGVMRSHRDRSYLGICKRRSVMCVYPFLISKNTKEWEWEWEKFLTFIMFQLLRIQNSDKPQYHYPSHGVYVYVLSRSKS